MTANASRLIDDLGPLNRTVLWLFEHERSVVETFASSGCKALLVCDIGSLPLSYDLTTSRKLTVCFTAAHYITQRTKKTGHLSGR
jgi:hypothetical protein